MRFTDTRIFVLGGWFTWVAVAVVAGGVIGAGATIYGANKQSDASAAANQSNQDNVSQANNESWTNYLMSRGLNPGGTVPYGTIPTGSQAVNTKLPLWATLAVPNKFASQGGGAAALQGSLGGSPGAGYSAGGGTPTPARAPYYPQNTQMPGLGMGSASINTNGSTWNGQMVGDG